MRLASIAAPNNVSLAYVWCRGVSSAKAGGAISPFVFLTTKTTLHTLECVSADGAAIGGGGVAEPQAQRRLGGRG